MKVENIFGNEIYFSDGNMIGSVTVRPCLFDSKSRTIQLSNVEKHPEHIVRLFARQNNISLTCECGLDKSVLNAQIDTETSALTAECDDRMFSLSGFIAAMSHLLKLNSPTEDDLLNLFYSFGILLRHPSTMKLYGVNVDLRNPVEIVTSKTNLMTQFLIASDLEKSLSSIDDKTLLTAMQKDIKAQIISTKKLSYDYILGNPDMIMIYAENQKIQEIQAAECAKYGINILSILNTDDKTVRYICDNKEVDKISAVAHIYYPDKFKGNEPVSIRHYIAFKDGDSISKCLDENLAKCDNLNDKLGYLNEVKAAFFEFNWSEMIPLVESLTSSIVAASKQASNIKSLDKLIEGKNTPNIQKRDNKTVSVDGFEMPESRNLNKYKL